MHTTSNVGYLARVKCPWLLEDLGEDGRFDYTGMTGACASGSLAPKSCTIEASVVEQIVGCGSWLAVYTSGDEDDFWGITRLYQKLGILLTAGGA